MKQVMMTYYEVLGVDPKAKSTEIKRAYHERVRLVHPDVVHSDEAMWRVKLLNRAYAVLNNRTRRAEYDESIRLTGRYNCNTTAEAQPTRPWRWLLLSMWWVAAMSLTWLLLQLDLLKIFSQFL